MSEEATITDEFLFCDEGPSTIVEPEGEGAWKVMIVDDEEAVHVVTRMVLADFVFEGKGLEFIGAYSGEEAKLLLKAHPDTAIVLLDVVMERDDSGLVLVRHIREVLGNSFVRIVLRTGLAGIAPVEKVIVDFDINDYTEKTELTAQKLFIVIISALRSYRDIIKSAELAAQLRKEIAERRHAEEKLRASEEMYASIFTHIGIGIALINPDMEILFMNPIIEKWSPHVDVSQHPICYKSFNVPPRNAVCTYCPTIQTFRDGQIHISITDTPMAGGIRHFRIISTPVLATDGSVSAVIEAVEDITEKRKLEEDVLRAQKLESVGLLAGGIAHDFNNLLTAIMGNISLAKAQLPTDDRTQRRLVEAEKASLRAKDLTQQLLTFAKGGAPVRRSACVSGLIRETARFALSGSNVSCEFAIGQDLHQVEIDEGQISQVIHNLIINADQAMPVGGTIRIVCDEVTLADDEAPPLRAGRYIRITIGDQGVGIPAEHLQRIFDPYFTTKEKGRGLGLASAYSIIRNHDGQISVSSEPGRGTTFTIHLPVSEVEPVVEKGEERIVLCGKGRILIMDDEEIVLEIAGNILSHLGYQTEFARDGGEAVELFRKAREAGSPFKAVLLDLTIPGGMGGKETIARLRKIDAEVMAMVSSGYCNDPVMSDYRSYGFSGVISKPYRIEEMAKAFVELLA
jgi:two-component system cell cycle sensor histidine kinase/response regulator CckA